MVFLSYCSDQVPREASARCVGKPAARNPYIPFSWKREPLVKASFRGAHVPLGNCLLRVLRFKFGFISSGTPVSPRYGGHLRVSLASRQTAGFCDGMVRPLISLMQVTKLNLSYMFLSLQINKPYRHVSG
jgi:hypothetical protein